jgi:hypothetical protein
MPCPNKPSGEWILISDVRAEDLTPAEMMHFMVKTGADKFNPEDRKIIRSHVMKGKNLGKIRPPRRRRDLDLDDLRQNVLSSSPSPSDPDTSSPTRTKGRDGSSSPRASSSTTPLSECYPVIISPASIPRKFGSVASAICFADSVKPATVDVVLQCEFLPTQFHALHLPVVTKTQLTPNTHPVSSIAKQLLFPLETCIFFERRAENWIAPLAIDPAYLHAKIFTSLYYFDMVLPRRSSHVSQRTWHHHHKALSLLRERLLYGNDDARLSNNTVSVVLSLAGYAFWTGDVRSARNHMEGMRKIASLRGGMSTFRDNEKLLAEILR